MKTNEEEYEWHPYKNDLEPLTYSDAIQYAVTEISKQYTITE